MKTCKMNAVDKNGNSSPECTNCNHRFNTDYARNSYLETCAIVNGRYKYCPNCGAKYIGGQVNGIDLEKCSREIQRWMSPHLF